MRPKKAFYLFCGGILGCGVIVIGTVYAGNNMLGKKSRQIVELKTESDVNATQLANYQKLEQQLGKYAYLEEIIKKVLPTDKEQSVVLSQVTELAKQAGIAGLTNAQFGDASIANDAKSAAPTQTKADAIKGVYILPMTFELKPEVSYIQVQNFMKLIEQNQRKMQITGLTLTPSDKDRNNLSQVSFQVDIYLKP